MDLHDYVDSPDTLPSNQYPSAAMTSPPEGSRSIARQHLAEREGNETTGYIPTPGSGTTISVGFDVNSSARSRASFRRGFVIHLRCSGPASLGSRVVGLNEFPCLRL